MGIQQMMFGGGLTPGYQTALVGGTITNLGGVATLSIDMDGIITLNGSSSSTQFYYYPQTTNIGFGHYARLTNVSGSTFVPSDSGYPYTTGWTYASNSTMTMGLGSAITGRTAVYTLEIASDAGSTIVCTGTFTFVN